MVFERLEPWGDEWRQIATLIQNLWNTQLKPEDQFRTCEAWMPLPPRDPDDEDDDEDDCEPADARSNDTALLALLAGHGIRVRPLDHRDQF